MSGFEIAGVVLAAVPLIVLDLHTAYEKGARGFLRWRRCEREVKYLIRNLETQQIILRNVCETLIIDVADLTEIDDMINNPLGPLWSEPRIQAGVQQKLWHNPALFKEIVKDVNKAVEELKEMLNIDGVEMALSDKNNFVIRHFQKASFTWNRFLYEDQLKRIQEGVAALEKLVPETIPLEPHRQSRFRGRLSGLTRDLNLSIYRAMRRTFICSGCHFLTLRLAPLLDNLLPDNLLPQQSDKEILHRLMTKITLSSHVSQDALASAARAWEEVLLRLVEDPTEPPEPPAPPPVDPSTLPQKKKFTFTIRQLEEPQKASDETMEIGLATADVATSWGSSPRVLTPVNNLCDLLSSSQKLEPGDRHGSVFDLSDQVYREFAMYSLGVGPVHTDADAWSLVSLGDILRDTSGAFPPLVYSEKLRIAALVALGAVQFSKTDWVSEYVTPNDVYFVYQGGKVSYRDVFFLSRVPEAPERCDRREHLNTAQNPALLALGFLLIELALEAPLSRFWRPGRCCRGLLANYQAAMDLLNRGRVCLQGGLNYETAVRRCLKNEFRYGQRGLEDGSFRAEVIAGIVTPLEESVIR